MPQLRQMEWDFKDSLRMSQRQAVDTTDVDGSEHEGERTWYVYDSAGQRVHKVTELPNNRGIKDEWTYLDGFEIYRRRGVNSVVRESLHITVAGERVALIDTRIQGHEPGVPPKLTRYQLADHLGSATVEVDDQADLISSEEFSPYGSSMYQAVRNGTGKRYRFTGRERDEESGLYYNGARYYIPWLGRWSSCDPLGLLEGVNPFLYARVSPLGFTDVTGMGCDSSIASCPELMSAWPYGERVPNRSSLGHDVQREHPKQLSLTAEQRGRTTSQQRRMSARAGESTILVESGVGHFRNEVGYEQRDKNRRVRAGTIVSETEIIEATREGYERAAARTGTTVNHAALNRAFRDNQALLHEEGRRTIFDELRHNVGATSEDFDVSDETLDRAFRDPDPPTPTARRRDNSGAVGTGRSSGTAQGFVASRTEAVTSRRPLEGDIISPPRGVGSEMPRWSRRVAMGFPLVDAVYQQLDYANTAYTGDRTLDLVLNVTVANTIETPLAVVGLLEGLSEMVREGMEAETRRQAERQPDELRWKVDDAFF